MSLLALPKFYHILTWFALTVLNRTSGFGHNLDARIGQHEYLEMTLSGHLNTQNRGLPLQRFEPGDDFLAALLRRIHVSTSNDDIDTLGMGRCLAEGVALAF